MGMTATDTSSATFAEPSSAKMLDVASTIGVLLESQRGHAKTIVHPSSSSTSESESFWGSYSRHGLENPFDFEQMKSQNMLMGFDQHWLLSSTAVRRFNARDTSSISFLYSLNPEQNVVIVAQLSQIELYASKGELRKAMVAVYDTVCALLADSRFDDCDQLLEKLTSTQLPADVTLSFFMAAASAPRALLPSRVASYEANVARITSEGNAEVLEALKMCK